MPVFIKKSLNSLKNVKISKEINGFLVKRTNAQTL
jgi:hypothetical protein